MDLALGRRVATAPPRPGLGWVGIPALIASVSRAYSLALVVLANDASSLSRRNPFDAWDAGWYLSIAGTGYHAAPVRHTVTGPHFDFAFFPLWPAAIRLSTLGILPDRLTAVVAANLLVVAATVLVWRLLADRFGGEVATGSILLLAFSPPAYVFSLAYSEPLFLLVAAAYFLDRGPILRRPVLAAAAVLARIAGAAIVASAAVEAVAARGRARRVAWLTVIAGGIAFAGWWVFIALLTRDALGFLHGSPAWDRSTGLVGLVDDLRRPTVDRLAWAAFVGLAAVGSVLVLRRDRELGVFALTAIALGLLPGGVLDSMPRYAVVAFPAFAGLAGRLGRRGTLFLAFAFAVAQWAFVAWAFIEPGAQAP